MVRAQIGDSPNVRIFVLGPSLIRGVFFLGNVVDTALVLLAVRVHHGGTVSAAGVTLTLHVPFLLAIAANHLRVAGAIAPEQGRVDRGGGCWGTSGCRAGCPILADGGNFVKILVSDFVPKDGRCFLWANCCFDGCNLVRPSFVIVDGFQLPGQLHALFEGGLAGFKDPVPDGLLDACQEELVFEKQSHVVDTFLFDVVRGGAGSSSDGVDGGGPVVDQAVIGYLYPAAIIVHQFIRVLL
jgi:hypothetical protein